MGVRTTADEEKEKAVEALGDAIRYLSELVIHRCSGYTDYSEEYRKGLIKSFMDLVDIRDRIA
jgi:hypothetical protein